MASSKQSKTEEAEAAAKLAATDLEEVNRQKKYEEGIKMEETTTDTHQRQQQEEEKPGVIGSVLKAVHESYEHAKEAVVGKSGPETTREGEDSYAAEKLAREGEYNRDDRSTSDDSATGKAEEYKDYTTQKAKETKEQAARKTEEYEAAAAERAGEAKDSAADKAKQAKETTLGKAKEAKDTTAEKAKEMKDYAAEKAEQGKEKLGEYKDSAVEKAKETKDYTADKAKHRKDTTMEKMGEYKDYTAEKAKEGKDTTVSKLGELKDSATGAARKALDFLSGKKGETQHEVAETAEKAKLTEEEEARRKMEELKLKGYDTVQKTTGENKDAEKFEMKVEGIEIAGEDTRPGYGATTIKAADQMSGQTFNDVGRIDDEGLIRLEPTDKDRQGKM
ncbi:Late embryogenesis abundant protein LEA [Parasponia andersonii]|uniref:Late embryogenesis abundant protein LEA n=1 Tax=Parasponia andersonii TaxID=3476 RepID=A0A2P5C536_PARAD|nr:Late embryogenesis abundant protein LEA [Parasponia andersonii]